MSGSARPSFVWSDAAQLGGGPGLPPPTRRLTPLGAQVESGADGAVFFESFGAELVVRIG
jgi:hypothetical protein